MTRLLVFSHAAVLSVNRTVFRVISDIANAEVCLVVPTKWRGDLIRDLNFEYCEEDKNLKIISLPTMFSGNGSLFFYSKNIKKNIPNWNPDIIFAYEEPWSLSCFQAYLSFRDSKKYFFTNQNLYKKVPFPFNYIQKWIFKNSLKAFPVSEDAKNVLKWKGYDFSSAYLPFSYDDKRFKKYSENDLNKFRKKLNLSRKKITIAYFGRIDPEKGIEDFLDAISLLSTKELSQKLQFLVVGNGSIEDSVHKRISTDLSQNTAYFPAFTHDTVFEGLSVIDVLVVPSRTVKNWKEQFGRIIIEAMACSTAVIGSDSGEIPKLIKRSNAGLIFPERNINSLANSIEILAEDQKRLLEFKISGENFAKNNFSHKKVAEHFLRELNIPLRKELL